MVYYFHLTHKNTLEYDINLNLEFFAKSNVTMKCFYLDEYENLIDITDAEVYFIVKNLPSDEDSSAVLNKKITSLTDPTNGEADIELTSAEISSLLGNYIYQIKVKYDDEWYLVSEGMITFKRNIIVREE